MHSKRAAPSRRRCRQTNSWGIFSPFLSSLSLRHTPSSNVLGLFFFVCLPRVDGAAPQRNRDTNAIRTRAKDEKKKKTHSSVCLPALGRTRTDQRGRAAVGLDSSTGVDVAAAATPAELKRSANLTADDRCGAQHSRLRDQRSEITRAPAARTRVRGRGVETLAPTGSSTAAAAAALLGDNRDDDDDDDKGGNASGSGGDASGSDRQRCMGDDESRGNRNCGP